MNSELTSLDELPKGWVWTSLTHCSREIYRYPTFYGMEHLDSGIPVIRGEHIKGDATISHDWSNYWFVSPEVSGKYPRTITEVGDIIMSVRGSVGKIGIIDEKLKGAQVSPNCIKIALFKEQCFPSFVVYYLRSVSAQALINTLVNATTIQTIKAGLFTQIHVPLPPFPEQHRIVAKIEELFTRLDASVEAIKIIKAQLKRYRQSVLKHAFEGKLTHEWRQVHKHELEPASVLLDRIKQDRQKTVKRKYKELPPLDTSNLPELPESWAWAKVAEIGDVVSGQTPKEISHYGSGGQIPYFRVGDMNKNGNEKYMLHSEVALSLADIKRLGLHVQPGGTVIFPKRGGAIATNKKRILANPSAYDLNTMGVCPLSVPHMFLYYWMLSIDLAALSDGSNVPQINHGDIQPLPFPLPTTLEQHQIVGEIERRFSVADEIERTIDQGTKQAERLRQSILKKAFEGKLIPQDPNDEPAERLLERIRQQRAKQIAEKQATVSKAKRRQGTDWN